MSNGIGQVHVRKQRGKMVVQVMGQTPTGQSFIKQTAKLKAKSGHDPKLKEEILSAVEKLFEENGSPA